MHSGCLLMLAPGGVDTSSRLSLSLPATAESARVRGRRRRSRTAEISPRPASQPARDSEHTDCRWCSNLSTGQTRSLSNIYMEMSRYCRLPMWQQSGPILRLAQGRARCPTLPPAKIVHARNASNPRKAG